MKYFYSGVFHLNLMCLNFFDLGPWKAKQCLFAADPHKVNIYELQAFWPKNGVPSSLIVSFE